MGIQRSAAVLIWPFSAAAAIVAVLLLHHPFRDALQPILGWRSPSVVARGPVTTRPLIPPRTLAAPRPTAEGLEGVGAAVAAKQHARRDTGADRTGAAGMTAILAPPGDFPAAARLHAPLRDDREELAGWDDGPRGDVAPPSLADAANLVAGTTNPLAGTINAGTIPLRLASQRLDASVTVAAKPSTSSGSPLGERLAVGEATGAWPATPALDGLLSEAVGSAAAADWENRVRSVLLRLQRLPSIAAADAGPLLRELDALADEGLAQAEALADRQRQLDWLRAAHGVKRRCAVWRPLWETVRASQVPASDHAAPQPSQAGPTRWPALTQAVRHAAGATGDTAGWSDYLLLDAIDQCAQAQEIRDQQRCAQRFLSRLEWAGLEPAQRAWLQDAAVQRLAAVLRPWATGPVDYGKLLQQLERQEADAIDLVGIDVAATVQTLRFADRQSPQAVADAINSHYRNANLRLAVSQQLLARLLPNIPDRQLPVRQTLLGTRIAGNSRVASRLDLRLVPSETSWSIQLLTLGDIQASTVGRQGPVSVRNGSQAQFQVATPVQITPTAITVGDAQAQVQQNTRLRGLTTDYDGIPLVGSLVRAIAASQYEQASGAAQRISRSRTQTQIEQEVGGQIEQQIAEASGRFSEQLLGPLGKLQLDPLVVDLRTDQHRLSARYRLAGDWQLAAFTPRPRAPSDSLLSVQLHQSAMNNTFERLAPSDQPRSVRSVAAEILTMFGRADAALPDDLPDDVRVQFARTRPVTVEIDDDLLWVTFRIVRLVGDGGLDLRHFIVRAAYRGEVQGLQARLVRDGHLRVSAATMSMRDRVPVRAIFTKILSESRPIHLVSAQWADHPASDGMTISQLELRAGWIALAIGPQAGTLAALPSRSPK